MRARLPSTRAVVLLLLIVLVSACRGGDVQPEPSTPPPPDPQNPDPLTLAIEHIELAPMGNGEILTGAGQPADLATAEAAVEATRAALERFLNAQFVEESTRFTEGPARALLQPGVFDSLPPEQRAAMGVQYQPVVGVLARSATGTATVLFEQGRAYAVSIEYGIEIELHYPQAPLETEPGEDVEPVDSSRTFTHGGTVLFTAPTWAVESFEFQAEGPDVPVPPPSPPATPSSEASPSSETTP